MVYFKHVCFDLVKTTQQMCCLFRWYYFLDVCWCINPLWCGDHRIICIDEHCWSTTHIQNKVNNSWNRFCYPRHQVHDLETQIHASLYTSAKKQQLVFMQSRMRQHKITKQRVCQWKSLNYSSNVIYQAWKSFQKQTVSARENNWKTSINLIRVVHYGWREYKDCWHAIMWK